MTESALRNAVGGGVAPSDVQSRAVGNGDYLGWLVKDVDLVDLKGEAHFVFSKHTKSLIRVCIFAGIPSHLEADSDPLLRKQLALHDQQFYSKALVAALSESYGQFVASSKRTDDPGYDDEQFSWLTPQQKITLKCVKLGWLGGMFELTYEPVEAAAL